MIGRRFCVEQFRARRLAFSIELPDALLFLIGKPRRHRPCRYKDGRQMAETQRSHEQARHDLVANTEQQHTFKHRMTQSDSGAQRDGVAAKQRQFHAGLALRHPITHGRDAACHLCRCPHFAREHLDGIGIAAIRLMR